MFDPFSGNENLICHVCFVYVQLLCLYLPSINYTNPHEKHAVRRAVFVIYMFLVFLNLYIDFLSKLSLTVYSPVIKITSRAAHTALHFFKCFVGAIKEY